MQLESETLTSTMLAFNGTMCSRVNVSISGIFTASTLSDPANTVEIWVSPDLLQSATVILGNYVILSEKYFFIWGFTSGIHGIPPTRDSAHGIPPTGFRPTGFRPARDSTHTGFRPTEFRPTGFRPVHKLIAINLKLMH
jgi:hypothetical protein